VRLEQASALADALLAGPWEPEGMLTRARLVFAPEPVGLADLVGSVLRIHPDPPRDRPRALVRFLRELALRADADGDDDGDDDRDGAESSVEGTADAVVVPPAPRIRVVRRLLTGTAVVADPFGVPRLDDVGALARRLDLTVGELDWFADRRLWHRRERRQVLQHYRSRWIERPGRAPRLLEAPRPRLRGLQRRVLDGLLAAVPVHPAAHGFVPGRSALTGAAGHVGREVVVTVDLESFFASVTVARVFGIWRAAGLPEPVAHALAALCTTATPVDVLASAPVAAGSAASGAAFRLRRRLAAPHLPQGAPTSPALANLAAYVLDRRLAGLAIRFDAGYTRYADDLTFSGPLRGRTDRLLAAVAQVVADEGFRVHPGKTHVRTQAQRQRVTGVVVNASVAVPRAEFDRLRATLFNCARSGPQAQNRDGVPDFRAHLLGRIAWVASTDAARGRRLRALFDRIDWS
jgi:hypothetical protein